MLTILAATGNVIFYGLLGWFLARRIGIEAQARFAGSFLAIGFAIGSFSGHAGSELETVLVLRGTGYLLGVVAFIGLIASRSVRNLRREP